MLSVYLDVPYVTQLAIGGNSLSNDWTGCWYASACMIAYYFEAGPRLGDLSLTQGSGLHNPIQSADILKQNENLVEIPQPGKDVGWTLDNLAIFLNKWGPLLFSFDKTAVPKWGNFNHGEGVYDLRQYARVSDKVKYGHCCTLIGVDGKNKKVIYHDPENAPRSTVHISQFNTSFLWSKDSMLRKNVQAHTPRKISF